MTFEEFTKLLSGKKIYPTFLLGPTGPNSIATIEFNSRNQLDEALKALGVKHYYYNSGMSTRAHIDLSKN